MNSLEVAIRLTAYSNIGGAFGDLAAQAARADSALRMLTRSSGDTSDAIKNVGFATLGAGVALLAFALPAGIAVKQAGDLQMAMVRLQLATESAPQYFQLLQQAVVDMAENSLYSTTDMAGAFERLSEMGFSTQQVIYGFGPAAASLMNGAFNSSAAMQGLGRQAAAVGEAMQVSAVDGAQLLGTALNTFKNEGMSASQAANLLTGAFYNGIPDASGLQQAIELAGGAASASGVKFQDFVTTIAMLSQAGMSGSTAGASLRYMLQSLESPTAKQATEQQQLGLVTVETGAKFDAFRSQLANSGAAGLAASQAFDGTVPSLQAMFTAAQAAGAVPLNATFQQWAEKAGLLKDSFFNAQGTFIGFKGSLDVLDTAMNSAGFNTEEKMQVIADLFNVRSGRAAQILMNLHDFDAQYNQTWDRIGKVNALANAQKVMGTFQGSFTRFKTTVLSTLAEVATPWVAQFAKMLGGLNNFVGNIQTNSPQVMRFLQIFLPVGTIMSTAALGIGLVTLAIMAMSGPLLIVIGVSAGLFVLAGLITLIVMNFGRFFTALKNGNPIVVAITAILGALGICIAIAVVPALISLAIGLVPVILAFGAMAVAVVAATWPFIVFGAVVAAIIFGVIMVITHFHQIVAFLGAGVQNILQHLGAAWDWLKGKVGGVLDWLGTKIGGFFSGIGATVNNGWSKVKQLTSDLWNGVKGVVKGALDFITGIVGDAVHGIANFFGWLYNHNYYWKDLVDSIRNLVSGCITWLKNAWHDATSFLANAWNTIKGDAINAWNAVKNQIQAQITQAKNIVESVANAIKNAVSGAWNWISGQTSRIWGQVSSTVGNFMGQIGSKIDQGMGRVITYARQGWDNFVGAARDAAGKIGGAVKGIIDAILGPITDLGGQLLKAGEHLMSMLAQGIKNGLGGIKSAAGGVAHAITGFLGFHSPTEEGPGATSDQWMPNMMRMLASGITTNIPLVQAAAGRVASTVQGQMTGAMSMGNTAGALSMNSPGMFSPYAGATSGASLAGSGGQVIIPIQLDGQQIAQYTLDLATGQLQMNGLTRFGR